MTAPVDLERAAALLSGLVDAMRMFPQYDRVTRELRTAFDLSCGAVVYRSLCERPRAELWRDTWNAAARAITAHVESGGDTHVARARARRWSYHVSVIDAEWERV